MNSTKTLQTIVSAILSEHEQEINKILKAKILYQEFFGKELKDVSYEACLCQGDWCTFPMLHGFRFDGMSIKEIEKKITAKKRNIK